MHTNFKSWLCLTLFLPAREVNLVFVDETQLFKLIKFLIFKLRTLNGQKDSADKLLTLLNQNKSQREAEQNEQALFNKVYIKYVIMKIRHKISYHAVLNH
jgi:hypothetical protein